MKKIFYIVLLLSSAYVFSQNKGITYQAVIYAPGGQNVPGVNVSNVPLTNRTICLQFSFLDASSGLEYQEVIKTTTDEFGMVNLTIGSGNQTGGYASSFATIAWSAATDKSFKVALDATGLCNQFEELSVEKLASVPFANGALTAETVSGIVPVLHGGTGATTAAAARTNLGLGFVDNTSDMNKPMSTATKLYVDSQFVSSSVPDATTTSKGKIQLAGDLSGTAAAPTVPGLALKANSSDVTSGLATKENTSNKSTDATLSSNSDVKFPTEKAVKTYVDVQVAGATIADASATVKGKIQLAGDLSGTAAAPTVPGLALKENAANKSTTTTLGTSNVLFPTQNAVKTYVDTAIAGATIVDADATTKGKLQLAGDLAGTAAAPTVPGLALKENAANKSTTTTLGTSNVLFPTQNAVKTYVDTAIAGATIVDADATTKGKLQLAGDLAGTAAAPTVPGLALKENAANKSTTTTLGTSDVLFPTQNAVKTYVDTAIAGATIVDADATTKGKLQLAGDLTGTALSPQIASNAVTSAKILDGTIATADFSDAAVTYAKFQNLSATDKVLGRVSTGAGVVEEIATTGSGNVVRATSPTLVTPALGTPSAAVLTNATGLPMTTGVTGILPGANGGTGVDNGTKTISLGGNLTTSGAFATTITTTADSNVTLPTTGTLATLAGTETLTNKTLTSPTLTTPTLGVATATSVNKVTITAPTTSATLTIADGKTLTANNSIVLAGTDGKTMTFPTTDATIARTDAAQTFTGVQTFSSTIAGSITGNAATVTTNANLTGDVTSVGNATTIGASKVVSSMITDGTIVVGDMADNAVETAKIKDAAVTDAKLDKANIPLSGFGAATADVALGGKKLTGVANPTAAQDVATKSYVDTLNASAGVSDGSITYAKIQNVSATDKVLGRVSTGAGVVEEIATTGSGNVVRATSPTLVTPVLGAASATSVGFSGSTSGTATLAAPAVAGTTTITLPAATGTLSTLAGTETLTNKTLTSPTLTTPTLGVASATSVNGLTPTALATGFTIAGGSTTSKTLTVSGDATVSGTTSGTNTGDQTITLTGDVTGSGTGSFAATIGTGKVTTATIAADAVTSAKIADGTIVVGDLADNAVETAKVKDANITYAKIQNVSATDKVLGRVTAGAGVVEEIATTGTGDVVRATSPTLVTPALGTPSAAVLTNATGLPLTSGVTGILPLANGGTGSATKNFVDLTTAQTIAGDKTFSNTIKLTAGAPGAGKVLTSDANGVASWSDIPVSNLITGVTGILPLASGGTGSATQNFVDLTTAQTIAGTKTFSDPIAGSITGNAATVTTNANLTGDVTSSGNATTIGASKVVTGMIADGTIIVGDLADAAVETVKIKDANVTTSKLADDAVTTVKITNANITTAKLAADAVTSAKIKDGEIVNADVSTTAAIAYSKLNLANSIVAADLTTDAVETAKIKDANVTTAKLAADAVETAKIKDANVTYAKIQNVSATDKVLGRVSTGAGVVEEIATIGSGNVVRATSPTLVTPVLGAATATSVGFSGSTSGTATLAAPAVAGTTTITLPAATGTLATLAGTETLTNKTLTSPTMTAPVLGTPASGTLTNATGLPLTTGVTGILPGTNGGTGVDNGTKTITLGGNLTTSGAFATTLTATAATSVTLPTTGTLTTLAGTETLTNKTLTNPTLTTPTLGVATATTINGLTPTSQTTGFTISGGTTSKTLTVSGDATVSGTNTGDQTTITGNAGTATKLATTKNINGVAFDGSADITVTADATTLTGTSLKSTIVGSSLTSVGTLTNLTVTNAIAGSITGNAATVTNGIYTTSKISDLAATTSAELAGKISDETGTGALVFATSPTLVTPTLGVATATSVNKVAITAPTTSATLTIADGKTLTASDNATVSGTNTGDQTITLTGDVTGTGTGSFATTIGAAKVTNAMLAGSIDLTSKVTGILPVANGGTGSNTQNFVDLTTAQTVAGAKTFTSVLTVSPAAAAASSAGSNTSIAAQNATTANYAGGDLNLTAGNGKGTASGGLINLTPGSTDTAGASGYVNIPLGTTTATTGVNLTGSINDFLEYNVKNNSTGVKAQSGYNAMADNGTDATNFAWVGINNSAFNNPQTYNIGGANDVSFMGAGNDLYLANASATKSIIFSTGTATTPFFAEKMRITNAGNVGIGTNAPDTTTKLHVAGSVKIVDGTQGVGKVLTSDANGIASWNSNPNTAIKTITSPTTTYTILTADKYVIYSNSAAGTITLPDATSSGVGAGKEFIIKNISAFGVTVNTTSTQKIVVDNVNNAATSATLGVEASNNWIRVISDGTQWIAFRALF